MIFKRILCVLLAVTMILADIAPVVYAVEAENQLQGSDALQPYTTDTEEYIVITESQENSLSAEESSQTVSSDETSEKDVLTDSDEETFTECEDTTETDESTVSDDAETADDETQIIYDKFAVFNGMPQEYVLSENNQSIKKAFIESGAVEEFLNNNSEYIYSENEILVYADSEEEAVLFAAAYNAELLEYEYGLATMVLDGDIPVRLALEYGIQDNNVPAVFVNSIYTDIPAENHEYEMQTFAYLEDIPQESDWFDWKDGDPYLDTRNTGYQWHHQSVDTYAAWGTSQGSKDITVAIIDTGVHKGLEDLQNVTEIVMDKNASTYGNHGTHVAGIIAAEYGNGLGGAGIAPNINLCSYNAMSVKYSGITVDNVVRAINHAVDNGVDIINMSIGTYTSNPTLDFAVQKAIDKGVAVVVAAGNNGTNIKCYPAASEDVIAVTATDKSGHRAYFSNYGDWIDIAAPGQNIYSTINFSNYGKLSGTSQATPVVTGIIALYMSVAGDGRGDVNNDGHRNRDDIRFITQQLKKTGEKAQSAELPVIINAGNLLETVIEKPAPFISVNNDEVINTKNPVVLNSDTDAYIIIESDTYTDSDYCIVYSLDGKTPKIKDGVLHNGTVYDGNPIDISAFDSGKYTLIAVAVNGAGIASAPARLVFTIKWSESANIEIEGQSFVAKGLKAQYKAVMTDMKDSVKWSIDDAAAEAGIEIDSKGNLKVPRDISVDNIVITATAQSNPHHYRNFPVTITEPATSVKITSSTDSFSILTGDTVQLNAEIISGEDSVYNTPVEWKSSSAKIAVIDSDGTVTPVKRGKVKITAVAQDGTKKSATITLNISQRVEKIDITSATKAYDSSFTAAWGTNVQFSAEVLPKGAANKNVKFSFDTECRETMLAVALGVRITEKGRLSIPKDLGFTGEISIGAEALDGSGVTDSIKVKIIRDKADVIMADTDYRYATYNNSGSLKSLTMFTYENRNESVLIDAWADNDAPLEFTSSNNDIIVVDNNGTVTGTGKKTGKAVITVTALDGSGKNIKITVNVVAGLKNIEILNGHNLYFDQLNISAGGKYVFRYLAEDIKGKKVTSGMKWHLGSEEYPNPDPDNIRLRSNGTLTVSKDAVFQDGDIVSVQLVSTGNRLENGTDVRQTFVTLRKDRVSSLVFEKDAVNYYTDSKGKTAVHNMFTVSSAGSYLDISAGEDIDESELPVKVAAYSGDKKLDWVPPLDWKLSSSKLAELISVTSSQAVVTANNSAGSLSLNVKTLDGTNKTAKLSFKIISPVCDFEINTVQTSISRGKKASLKISNIISADNSRPSSSKIEWSVDDNARAWGVKISKSGVVSVPVYCFADSVTVTAETVDGSNIFRQHTFAIVNQAQNVYISNGGESTDKRFAYQKDSISEITLYTCPLEYTSYDYAAGRPVDESLRVLFADADTDTTFTWSSSDKSKLDIQQSEDGRTAQIRALKAGKVKLTVSTADGASKKKSVTVNILTPASGISISYNGKLSTDSVMIENKEYKGLAVVSRGKKVRFTAEFHDAFGTPSVKKADWQIFANPDELNVTIDKNGYLKVASTNRRSGFITIRASATDGSEWHDYYDVYVSAEQGTFIRNIVNLPAYYDDGGPTLTSMGGTLVTSSDAVLELSKDTVGSYYYITDAPLGLVTVKSSNPDIVAYYSVKNVETVCTTNNHQVYALKSKEAYPVYRLYVASNGGKKGKAKITVTTADGSNKSFSFNVTVK